MANERHFFSGANTPFGFYSYFDYILPSKNAAKIYCIKGGPGTGKSSFMRKIAAAMDKRGYDTELVHCSSDDHSLDGVVIKKVNVALMDGTSPHVMDPKYPGAVDTVLHLGDFWEEAGIRAHRQEIMRLGDEISGLYQRAYRYLGAARKLYDDIAAINQVIYSPYARDSFIESVVFHEFAELPLSPKQGNKRKLFASGITPNGMVNYLDTLIPGKKTYVLKGYAGDVLTQLADYAIKRGMDAELYFCPMDPENTCEHLLIPTLGLAFTTSNAYHSYQDGEVVEFEPAAGVSDAVLDVLKYDGEAMRTLLDRTVSTIRQAKALHDELEACYIPNMHFQDIDALFDKTLKQILEIA